MRMQGGVSNSGSALNPLQLACGVLVLILFLVLPIVSFGAFGVYLLHLNGIRLFQLGLTVYLIPLLAFLLMIGCSFAPMQRFSAIIAAAALVVEIIFAACAPAILLTADVATLLAFLPPEYASSAHNVLTTLITTAAKMGLGMYFVIGLTVLYGVFQFVDVGLGGRRMDPTAGTRDARNNMYSNKNSGGNIQRPQL
mgnify:CR=1 FL=1